MIEAARILEQKDAGKLSPQKLGSRKEQISDPSDEYFESSEENEQFNGDDTENDADAMEGREIIPPRCNIHKKWKWSISHTTLDTGLPSAVAEHSIVRIFRPLDLAWYLGNACNVLSTQCAKYGYGILKFPVKYFDGKKEGKDDLEKKR